MDNYNDIKDIECYRLKDGSFTLDFLGDDFQIAKELELFRLGIKPAMLFHGITQVNIRDIKHYLCKYDVYTNISVYNRELEDDRYEFILSWSDEIIDKLTGRLSKSLGIILGYEPNCVKDFEKRNTKLIKTDDDIYLNTFITYGGITFSCIGREDEALLWCDEMYKEKMLLQYDEFTVIINYKQYKKESNKLKCINTEIKEIKYKLGEY